MKIYEFYNLEDDKVDTASMGDTSRPRLSLKQIHRLRKARDAECADRAQHLEKLPTIYGSEPTI